MLPGIGFSELLLLGLAALIIVGPKDLPMMMRRVGQFVGKGRRRPERKPRQRTLKVNRQPNQGFFSGKCW